MKRFFSLHLDLLGFSASFLCAIHCMALPIVMSLGLFGGLTWFESPILEWGLIISTLLIATWSLFRSYYQQHRNLRPLLIAAIGFVLVFASHFIGAHEEHFVTAAGGFLIAYAHYVNWRLLRSCPTSSLRLKWTKAKAA